MGCLLGYKEGRIGRKRTPMNHFLFELSGSEQRVTTIFKVYLLMRSVERLFEEGKIELVPSLGRYRGTLLYIFKHKNNSKESFFNAD